MKAIDEILKKKEFVREKVTNGDGNDGGDILKKNLRKRRRQGMSVPGTSHDGETESVEDA